MALKLQTIYDRLLTHFGPQSSWSGETPFETLVGVVLMQNSNQKNAQQAIANLRDEGVLNPHALYGLAAEELEELIRPAGNARVKAKRLRNLLRWLIDRYGGDLPAMFAKDVSTLREELVTINGIGAETADSILLHAGSLPTLVVDGSTHRILKRHGWIDFEADYHQLKEQVESSMDADTVVYEQFHALLSRVGREHCGTRPKCDDCPLAEWLPAGGPLEMASF